MGSPSLFVRDSSKDLNYFKKKIPLDHSPSIYSPGQLNSQGLPRSLLPLSPFRSSENASVGILKTPVLPSPVDPHIQLPTGSLKFTMSQTVFNGPHS